MKMGKPKAVFTAGRLQVGSFTREKGQFERFEDPGVKVGDLEAVDCSIP